jgi:hypothetical protein
MFFVQVQPVFCGRGERSDSESEVASHLPLKLQILQTFGLTRDEFSLNISERRKDLGMLYRGSEFYSSGSGGLGGPDPALPSPEQPGRTGALRPAPGCWKIEAIIEPSEKRRGFRRRQRN